MHGVLNAHKPSGPTSHDIVSMVRRAAGQKKVGHAGTLDPAASGVLVVCLGNATRIVEYLTDSEKEYRAVVEFGIETDTEDHTGTVIREMDASHVSRELLESALPCFMGKINQIPPMVSAVHHEGKRLYELARSGIVVERQPRTVEIYALDLIDFIPGSHPRATLNVGCSKGTYIRTLCADIGLAINCVAHMASLVRTKVGRFSLDEAISTDDIQELGRAQRLAEALISVDDALSDMPSVVVSAVDVEHVKNGAAIDMNSLASGGTGLSELDIPLRIHGPHEILLGIGMLCMENGADAVLKPRKIFADT
jgi:tRNA pseudouridine55 synthase